MTTRAGASSRRTTRDARGCRACAGSIAETVAADNRMANMGNSLLAREPGFPTQSLRTTSNAPILRRSWRGAALASRYGHGRQTMKPFLTLVGFAVGLFLLAAEADAQWRYVD